MLAAQTGALPITQTMAQYDSQTGNAATVAAYYINAAAARLAVPVAAVVPLTDDSAGITVNARMDPLADLLHDQLDAAAVALPARVWLPGDDQPTNMRLDRPTILFTPQQVPAKPWLTWTDTSGGIVKGTLDGGLTTTPVIGDPTVAAAPDEIIVGVLADMGERLHIVEARG
jgi:hypothetical protein